MATMTEPLAGTSAAKSYHEYHAEAHVLSGRLERPIDQMIEPHAPVLLKGRRGGHLTRAAQDITIEGLITFKKGSTRVSGSVSRKNHGWVTLSTSIVEGLNVFEVITADRVVSQVSTEHPPKQGHVPRVTFLGSQFDNLRVSGFPVALTLDYGACGMKPEKDVSYLRDSAFLESAYSRTNRVADRLAKIADLPAGLDTEFAGRLDVIKKLMADCTRTGEVDPDAKVICSLVQSIDVQLGKSTIPGLQAIENVILVPDFGWVALGEIEVGTEAYEPTPYSTSDGPPTKSYSNYFHLKMVDMHLGCVGHGTATAGSAKSNGQSYP